MATVQITITAQVGEEFFPLDAAAEILFNAGIGNPENGEEWLNMRGQSYEITDFQSHVIFAGSITGNKIEVNLDHHLTNMGVEPK